MRSRSRSRHISLRSGAGAGAEVEVAFTSAMGMRPEPMIDEAGAEDSTHIRSLFGAGAVQKLGRLRIPGDEGPSAVKSDFSQLLEAITL